jgi:hypothetical protein
MSNSPVKLGLLAIMVLVALSISATSARADFEIQLSEAGYGTKTITDGGSGDVNPNTGAITYFGSFGTFSFTITTSESKPLIGSASNPQMDLNFLVNSSAAGTLTIMASDTDFTPVPAGGFSLAVGGTFNGPISQLTYQTFASSSNLDFGTSGPGSDSSEQMVIQQSPFSGTGYMSSDGLSAPYSLTQVMTITATGAGGYSSGDLTLSTPAPSSLMLLLSSSPVFGMVIWLRRRRLCLAGAA